MNLVICLLSTRQFLSAEQIRTSVAGYQDSRSDEAFNRMFERDKTELRDLGIPLETGRTSGWSQVDGYRINRDAYELPDVDLDADEAAAVAMAAALWSTPELSTASQSAVMKLRAAGVDIDADTDVGGTAVTGAPRALGSESVFGAVLTAINAGRAVRFRHRSTRDGRATDRTLEPWGVVTHDGRWYLVGHDRDRNEPRTFRLSRVSGPVTDAGRAGDVARPADADLRGIVAAAVTYSEPSGPSQTAQVWVAEGKAAGLRRMARDSRPTSLDGRSGSVLDIEIRSLDTLTRQVLGAGPDARVIEPEALRDRVVAGLRRLAGVST